MIDPNNLPDIYVANDGATMKRGRGSFTVEYKGQVRVVEVDGYYPVSGTGESVHLGADMEPAVRALIELKALQETSNSAPPKKRPRRLWIRDAKTGRIGPVVVPPSGSRADAIVRTKRQANVAAKPKPSSSVETHDRHAPRSRSMRQGG